MPQGLTQTEVQEKLKIYGFNELVDRSKTSILRILYRQIKSNFVIYMLVGSVIISLLVGKTITAYVISAVILLVISVGFIQEYKAEEAISSLKKMIMPISIAYRDGRKKEIPSREIVPGDLLVIGNGEKIPADCEILEAYELRINESTLTGESKEINKKTAKEGIQASDENRLFMGTYIVNGRCLARVIHTGMNTKFGKITYLISTAEKELPLQEKVNKIARYMVGVALIASVTTGTIMAIRSPILDSNTLTEILILVVALSVSAFPEGFPVVLITTLALGAKRMSKRNAIVNRMSIIETLGEVTVICSDKTGTLTRGEMTVKFIFTEDHLYEVGGSGYVVRGKITENGKDINLKGHSALIKLIEAGILCNDAEIERTGEDNEYHVLGSPTEASLLILGAKAGIYKDYYDSNNRVNEHPFNSERKMMSVLYKKENNEGIVYTKGAPEILLEKCTKILSKNSVKNFSKEQKEKIIELQKEMASNAFRTLCLAYKTFESADSDYQDEDFVFLGLVAMEDPPREEAKESVQIAQNAGIRVIMITGDSKETALSIAKQIGLQQTILDGEQLDQLSDQELTIAVKDTAIFARVRPEQKIRLVRVLKELNEIVAMTGDGVNDAPALKEAHVGIAMGKNGTDVSRSASDLILKDDNFATIVSAIAEGRTVYNNIRKFVTYQLSCNVSELLILFLGMLLAPFFGWDTPLLLALQILFMNLVTDNLPALTLGVNPTSNDIMDDKPRYKEEIINKELVTLLVVTSFIMTVTTLSSYFIAFNLLNFSNEESRTIALLTLILAEIVTAFSYRSFRKRALNRSPFVNKYLLAASAVSILATLVIIYTPVSTVFETVRVDVIGWLIALTLSFVVLVINDLLKLFNLRRPSYIASTK